MQMNDNPMHRSSEEDEGGQVGIILSYYPLILLSSYPRILLSSYPLILLSSYPIILSSYPNTLITPFHCPIYIHTYIHTYTYMHTYTHGHIHTYNHTHIIPPRWYTYVLNPLYIYYNVY
jgi:hypothetical protein